MNSSQMGRTGLTTLSRHEMEQTNGGFLGILIAAGGCLLLAGCINYSENRSLGNSRQTNITLNGQSVIGDSSRHTNNGTLQITPK